MLASWRSSSGVMFRCRRVHVAKRPAHVSHSHPTRFFFFHMHSCGMPPSVNVSGMGISGLVLRLRHSHARSLHFAPSSLAPSRHSRANHGSPLLRERLNPGQGARGPGLGMCAGKPEGHASNADAIDAEHEITVLKVHNEMSRVVRRALETSMCPNPTGQRDKSAAEVDADSAGGHFESKWQPTATAATFEQNVAAIAAGCHFGPKWQPTLTV